MLARFLAWLGMTSAVYLTSPMIRRIDRHMARLVRNRTAEELAHPRMARRLCELREQRFHEILYGDLE